MLGILSALLVAVDLKEIMSVVWQLLGILKIFIEKAFKSVNEKMWAIEGIFGAFEKGIENIVESCRTYFMENRFLFNFSYACEVRCSSLLPV